MGHRTYAGISRNIERYMGTWRDHRDRSKRSSSMRRRVVIPTIIVLLTVAAGEIAMGTQAAIPRVATIIIILVVAVPPPARVEIR